MCGAFSDCGSGRSGSGAASQRRGVTAAPACGRRGAACMRATPRMPVAVQASGETTDTLQRSAKLTVAGAGGGLSITVGDSSVPWVPGASGGPFKRLDTRLVLPAGTGQPHCLTPLGAPLQRQRPLLVGAAATALPWLPPRLRLLTSSGRRRRRWPPPGRSASRPTTC